MFIQSTSFAIGIHAPKRPIILRKKMRNLLLGTLIALVVLPGQASKSDKFNLAWEASRSDSILLGRISDLESTDCADDFGHRALKLRFVVEETFEGTPQNTIELISYVNPQEGLRTPPSKYILFYSLYESKCGKVLTGPGFVPVNNEIVDLAKFGEQTNSVNLAEFKHTLRKYRAVPPSKTK